MNPIVAVAALAVVVGVLALLFTMKVSELAGKITLVVERVDKIKTEVQALKDALGDVELPPAAVEALSRLETSVAGVDEINEDSAGTPPTDPEQPSGRGRGR